MHGTGKAGPALEPRRKAHANMHKQLAVRTSLIAAIAVLACFAIPAAAQAHHIDDEAKCELVGNMPTVSYTVELRRLQRRPHDSR